MSPVLVNPSRFTTGATPGSGYSAAVLADSPWGFWELTETGVASGSVYADSSPNGRDMSLGIVGGTPTPAEPGPSSYMPAILWPASDNCFLRTTATFNSAVGTVEVWFYLTAYPSAQLSLAACQNNASGSIAKSLRVNTDGTVSFYLTTTHADSSSPVALNTWHHAVGSVGPAGTKLRIDKVTVGTLATTTTSSSALSASLRGKLGGGTSTPGAVLQTAAMAVWTTQLSDAQIDAHYDAIFA